jgi:DnaJ-class molecular chaperone
LAFTESGARFTVRDKLYSPEEISALMLRKLADDAVKVHVPAGSSSGRRLRLRGEGPPNPAGRRGDLYAEVSVAVPATVSDRERALFQELAAVSTFDPRRESRG